MLNSIDPVVSTEYGYSVALSGNIAVIGDRNGMSTNGAAVVFELVCAACPWDCVGDDGLVGIDEFLAILGGWGGPGACDYDGDGVIGIAEFLKVLGTWGPCP